MRTLLRASAALAALLTLALTPACSLLGLDQVPRPPCFNHDDCQMLNDAAGISEMACMRFECTGELIAPGVPPSIGLQAGECRLRLVDRDGDGSHPFDRAGACAAMGGGPQAWTDCDDEDDRAVGEGTGEICDGIDNDCDFLVDENFVAPGSTVVTQPLIPQVGVAVSPFTDARTVYISPSGAGDLAIAWTNGSFDANYVSVPPGGRGLSGIGMEYASHASEISLRDFNEVSMQCPVFAGGAVRTDGSCNFADAAVSATETHVFSVAVTRQGCARGVLRAGHFDRDSATAEILSRGPARRSSSFLGLALNSCDPPPAMDDPRPAAMLPGAARPALNALDLPGTANDQALAVWVNDRVDRGECGGTPAPVVANALFLQSTMFGGMHYWVTASNEGVPEVLGQTLGGGVPAITRFEQRGWFVAYASESGGIALHYVPLQSAPPVADVMDPDPQSRVGVEVPALRSVIDFPPITRPGGGPVNDVSIATARIITEGVEVVLAWREGCGMADESIWYQRVVASIDDGMVFTDAAISPPAVQVAPDPMAATRPDRLGPPSIAYVDDGFLRTTRPEFLDRMPEVGPVRPQYGGGPDVPRAIGGLSDGGYFVAWAETVTDVRPRVRLLARRYAEIDGFVMDEDERLDLTIEGARESIVAPQIFVPGGSEVRVAYADSTRRELIEGRVTCLIPDCSPSTPAGRCTTTRTFCLDGVCRPSCVGDDPPCPDGLVCGNSGLCQPRP